MMLEVEEKRIYCVPELKDINPDLLLPARGSTTEVPPEENPGGDDPGSLPIG